MTDAVGVEGIALDADGVARCWWCAGDPLYTAYHDTEWGRPVDDDRRLFEKLSLEGFMAGLSWPPSCVSARTFALRSQTSTSRR
jgi:DNA-3-methyladenine glycosylase I